MPLSEKVALVTGGGRGIGRGIALALAKYGATVVVTARSTDEINAVADEIRKRYDRPALAITGDVSNLDSVRTIIHQAKAQFGQIDILINNAGILGEVKSLDATDPRQWAHTQQINLIGAYYMMNAVFGGMKARRYGRIVNIGSGAATGSGLPLASAYSVSKAGLDMLAKSAAAEVDDDADIGINSVYPGTVETAMQDEVRPALREQMGHKTRFDELKEEGKLTDPEAVGEQIVAVVLSDMNGEVLDVRDETETLTRILDDYTTYNK